MLTDGGVYDNLGLETAWKRYRTMLVSDGGGQYRPQARVRANWLLQTVRVLGTIDSQVRALRKRQVIGGFAARRARAARTGGSGARSPSSASPTRSPPDDARTKQLARMPTRLK